MSTPEDDHGKVRPWRLIMFADEVEITRPDGSIVQTPNMDAERAARHVDRDFDKTADEIGPADLTDPMPISPDYLTAGGDLDLEGYPQNVRHRGGQPELGEPICIDCKHYQPDRCTMFAQPAMPDDTCDLWVGS